MAPDAEQQIFSFSLHQVAWGKFLGISFEKVKIRALAFISNFKRVRAADNCIVVST